MGVHRERRMEAGGFVELLVAPAAKRRWSDEAKGRIVGRNTIAGHHGERGCASPCLEGEPPVGLADAGPEGKAGCAGDCWGRVRRAGIDSATGGKAGCSSVD